MKLTTTIALVLAMGFASLAVTPLLPPAWTHRLPPAWSPATRRVYRASSPIKAAVADSTANTSSGQSFKWVLHITYIEGNIVTSEVEGNTVYATRTDAYSKMMNQVDVLKRDGWSLQWQSEFVMKNSTSDTPNQTLQYGKDGVVCVMSINKFLVR